MAVYLRECAMPGEERFKTFLDGIQRDADDCQPSEYAAACKLQAWWRGVLTRGYLAYLRMCCVRVQSCWRGVLGRREYREILQTRVDLYEFQYYYNSAAKIQALWRGYVVRRDISDFYARKRFLEGLTVKEEIFRKELLTERQRALVAAQREQNNAEMDEITRIAEQHHHMASTVSTRGVYNSFNCTERNRAIDDTMHARSRHLKPSEVWHERMEQHYFTVNAKLPAETSGMTDPTASGMKWTGRLATVRDRRADWKSNVPVLPPIQGSLQGPFLPPDLVKAQRKRPAHRSVHSTSDYQNARETNAAQVLSERRKRMHDPKLKPFTKVEYQPVSFIHCKSPVQKAEHGTIHFRDPASISSPDKDFQLHALSRKIPLFDGFNKTYSS
ncbi:spermatogenesis-associated protein 17-like [Sycon ciliatum]|uniref:spermatogenesis-associated protein 17-like n=1 Tax=Sycon ciliatum TaxID=27933 RepID=UPI0031F6C409